MAETVKPDPNLWQALKPEALDALESRDYTKKAVAEALSSSGVEAAKLLDRDGLEDVWIPGSKFFPAAFFSSVTGATLPNFRAKPTVNCTKSGCGRNNGPPR